jgi:hypothetical protein
MACFGSAHRGGRDRAVERHQPAAVLHREPEQTDIGELLRDEDARAIDQSFSEKRDVVGPE